MKRLASSIVVLFIFVLSACTAQTDTQPIEYRYIRFRDVVYIETETGRFQSSTGAILLEFLTDRTVYRMSFSAAVVTVFTDGSMTVAFGTNWTAECPPDDPIDACTIPPSNPARLAEFASLIAFRDVEVLTDEFTPPETFDPRGEWWKPRSLMTIVVVVYAIFYVYLLLIMFLPPGARNRILPSNLLRFGKSFRAGNGRTYDSNLRYWEESGAVVATMKDEFQDRYGKGADHPEVPPSTTFAQRLRSHLPILIGATVLLAAAVAGLLLS